MFDCYLYSALSYVNLKHYDSALLLLDKVHIFSLLFQILTVEPANDKVFKLREKVLTLIGNNRMRL